MVIFACGFPNGDSKVATPTEETLCKFPRYPVFQLMVNPWPGWPVILRIIASWNCVAFKISVS